MSSFAFCLAVAVCSSSVSALRKTWRQHSVGERSSIGIFAVKKWSLEISSRSLCRTLACFLQHFKIQWQGPLNFRSPRCAPSGVLRQTLPDYVNGLHHSPAGWRGVQCFGSSPNSLPGEERVNRSSTSPTMRLQVIASALALPGAAFALSDSSPWVLLSTSK